MDHKVELKLTDKEFEAIQKSNKAEFIKFLTRTQLSGFKVGARVGSEGAFEIIEKQLNFIITTAPENAPSERDAAMVAGSLAAFQYVLPHLREQNRAQLADLIGDMRRDNG